VRHPFDGIKQTSLDPNLSNRLTRKQVLPAQMQLVVRWAAPIDRIAPYWPEGRNGSLPFAL
jgi:IS5 family transposase